MEKECEVNKLAEENNAASPRKRLIPTLADTVEYFKQYCSVTAIHGVRYLAEGGLYLFER